MAIYGIKDSANLTIKYKNDVKDSNGDVTISKGTIFAYADYALSTTNEWTSEQVYARSKSVNAIRWDYNKQSTLAVEMEIFDLKWIAMLSGTDFNTQTKEILKREVLTVETDKKMALGRPVKTGSLSVFKLEDDGVTNGTEITATTGYTHDSTENVIEIKDATVSVGDKIAVFYMIENSSVKTFTIEANKFPGNFEIYADTMIRKTSGDDDFVQIHYLNLKPQANFTITMDANNITTLSVTFDVLKDSGSDDMAEYSIYQ